MGPRTLGGIFRETVRRDPGKKAIFFREGGGFKALTWAQFAAKTEALACFFIREGFRPGDRIAIFSENRPEWAQTDLAAQLSGLVTVPIYCSLAAPEIQYLLSDAAVRVAAVSREEYLAKILSIRSALPELRCILLLDEISPPPAEGVKIVPLSEAESRPAEQGMLDERLGQMPSGALASIIYTSGTTGPPKGAMLTHENFIHNLQAIRKALHMSSAEVHLSFLPLSHVFERTCGQFLMVYLGAAMAYAENMDTVGRDLLEIRPTFLMGVPRFYEKMKDRILEGVGRPGGWKSKVFEWARAVGGRTREARRTGKSPGLFLAFQRRAADLLVYRKIRARFGGRLRFCVSGSAPLGRELAEFLYDLGVFVIEGYGLTETSPVISANREDRFRLGTVGIPLDGIEVRIAPDGEILTKSPSVMKGYYGKEAETREAIKDGWFYTGDLGSMDADGFLTITGRKKELIVTSGGKKVSPARVEGLVERDPRILRCVLYGEGRRFLSALLVPDPESVRRYARQQGLDEANYAELLKRPEIAQWIRGLLDRRCEALARFETIKHFVLLDRDFSVENGELTPTLKVRRDAVLKRHEAALSALYESERS